jgi:hypothetical protein
VLCRNNITSLGVKITDPAKGQQVAIGKNLTVSGISSYNATSNCGVFAIVDGVRPYQKTIPIGQNDYSKYRFTPANAGTVREGINRITGKLLCQTNPANLTKFYSDSVFCDNAKKYCHRASFIEQSVISISSNTTN